MKRLWALRRRILALFLRVAMTAAGVLTLYHEVFQAKTVDPLLIFLGLYLCGVPPAMFFDGLRRWNDFMTGLEAQQSDPSGPDAHSPPPEQAAPPTHHGPWDV